MTASEPQLAYHAKLDKMPARKAMLTTIRSKNLDLIRWLNFGHKNTAKKLSSLTNENYISKMATGDMAISDYDARQIEKILSLPDGWMDRDNIALLSMSDVDFKINTRLSSQPQTAKDGLLIFLESSVSK
ncbi:MAG: hypothetical protein Q8L39_14555 [Burkholderiales bacterium]|nr:hypothetical protein [Burkholderiales bacterium]